MSGKAREPSFTDAVEKSYEQVMRYCEQENYVGYGKFDALNSPLLKALTLNNKWLRLLASQAIKSSPINLRPILGVAKSHNPKGMALFAQAYLCRFRTSGRASDLDKAAEQLDWLLNDACRGYSGHCWGYHWDWQDLGFFAPSRSPNCVVSCFVAEALLDGYETVGHRRYLEAAESCAAFILNDLKILHEDEETKCISYVPDTSITMRVMDVSVLAGALLARLSAITHCEEHQSQSRKLMEFVARKQTDYGAWYYTDPPGASPITHDNYHTAFILDAFLRYGRSTGDDSYAAVYQHGLDFYQENLFCRDGAPKWTHEKTHPFDIHGAGTAIGTFARAAQFVNPAYLKQAEHVAQWATQTMQDPKGYFYYQKGRYRIKQFTLMRWCNAWMANGLSNLMLARDRLKED